MGCPDESRTENGVGGSGIDRRGLPGLWIDPVADAEMPQKMGSISSPASDDGFMGIDRISGCC